MYNMWDLKKENNSYSVEQWLPGVGKCGRAGKSIRTFSYKINEV